VSSHRSPVTLSGERLDRHALEFDGVPHEIADLSQFEPPGVFDLLDHQAEGIDMGGQAARRVVVLARPSEDQRTFEGPLDDQIGNFQRAECLFDTGDGFGMVAGRAGGIEQVDQEICYFSGFEFRHRNLPVR
jgi:hypothetical protein